MGVSDGCVHDRPGGECPLWVGQAFALSRRTPAFPLPLPGCESGKLSGGMSQTLGRGRKGTSPSPAQDPSRESSFPHHRIPAFYGPRRHSIGGHTELYWLLPPERSLSSGHTHMGDREVGAAGGSCGCGLHQKLPLSSAAPGIPEPRGPASLSSGFKSSGRATV